MFVYETSRVERLNFGKGKMTGYLMIPKYGEKVLRSGINNASEEDMAVFRAIKGKVRASLKRLPNEDVTSKDLFPKDWIFYPQVR